jgi:endonuclease YncB( thermonuclease family)
MRNTLIVAFERFRVQRRTFLTVGGTLGAVALGIGTTSNGIQRARAAPDSFPSVTFDSTASLLDADGQPLTDDSLIAVWAEDTAYNVDEDGDGNAVSYPDDTPIPLVASESSVVGFGAPIAQDDTNFQQGNEEVVLNVFDAEVGGSGTVAFDEGHGQFYDTEEFGAFIDYAESNGYAIEPTTTLTADLDGAQGAIVTSPSEAFTESELNALATFVGEGGALLLFSQSDFRNFDATANLNAIADAVGASFRFNDDQVLDPENNVGPDFIPLTGEFNSAFPYFEDRSGLGVELDPAETYTVDVVEVTDGDTIDVRFDNGTEDTVRILGIDTPETSAGPERVQEWEGIESIDYLLEQGEAATEYAEERLAGEPVEIGFDENEPLRGDFGRLLAYVTVDGTLYNEQAIADGRARVYDSGLTRHDAFLENDVDARAAGRGLWAESEPTDAPTVRNDSVEELFFPRATSVTSMGDPLDPKRVPVAAAASAEQEGDPEVQYDAEGEEIPLVGIDQLARVAMVGAPLIDEAYETEEGFEVDTSGYGNFPFVANLVDRLSDREDGPVLIDGGHGQFDADYALSAEDAAYYLRYLEGVDIGFCGVNDIAEGFGATRLDEARAIVVTTPVEAFADGEIAALDEFVADGGGVLLMGAGAPTDARENLNAIAEALCSDLQLNTGRVTDSENGLGGDPSLPVTSNFDEWFRLFGKYTGETKYKGARGGPGRPGCR